jgi:hypothetical protein
LGHIGHHAALTALALAGCASGTHAFIQVSGASDPQTVTINVFDGFGRIGHAEITPARLPGRITIDGLPPAATELRVVAIGSGAVPTLGGVRVGVMPGQDFEARIVLSPDTPDGDADLVPDDLDDCAAAADPLQENVAGSGAGDACRPDQIDLSVTVRDLGVAADLASLSDLAANDDLSPLPDLGPTGSLCATAGVPFCDGFESPTLSSHWAAVVQSGGTVTVDTTRAYRGVSSLHLHQNALGSNGASDVEINESQSFPAAQLWVRAFVYLPGAFAADDADLVLAEQNTTPYGGILLGVQGTSLHTNNTLTGTRKTSTTVMPRDRWVCLEWTIQFGASGTTALTVDGVAANNLGGAQNLAPTPAIGQLGLSLIAQAPPGGSIAARDVWIDEVIVDTKAVGCAR